MTPAWKLRPLVLLAALAAGGGASCGGGSGGAGADAAAEVGVDTSGEPGGVDRDGTGSDDTARDGAPESDGADRSPDGSDGIDGGADQVSGADGGDADAGGAVCPAAPDGGAPAPQPDNVVFEPNVTVVTLAGGPVAGATDGPASLATLANPVSVIVEPAGTVLVCDFDNDLIRRVDANGAVTTVTNQSNFARPFGFAQGPAGELYVDTDYDPSGVKNRTSGTIWRLDPITGAATVVAARVGRPRGLAALPDGRLVMTDYQNDRVRLVDPTTGAVADLAGSAGCRGMADGQGAGASFATPYGAVVLPGGGIVVADYDNHRLRLVTSDGQVSPYAGDGGIGTVDGPRLSARFVEPQALAIDAAGNIYVSDGDAHRIRRVGQDGAVTTVAGDGTVGFRDGTGAEAELYGQQGIAVTPDGKTLFVADGNGGEVQPYNRIRKITLGP